MDERRPSTANNRLSGLPKPRSATRMPLPKPTPIPASTGIPTPPSLRTAVSREGLRGLPQSTATNDPRATTPRLRATVSRDSLNAAPSSTLRKPARAGAPPVSSQQAIRSVRTRSATRDPEYDGAFKKPLPPSRRRPSAQLVPAEAHLPEEAENDVSPSDPADQGPPPSLERTPRLSLAERTVETLSQLPSSPAGKLNGSDRRAPDLTSPDPIRSPASRADSRSRPGSSYQSDGSSSGPSEKSFSASRAPRINYNSPVPPGQTAPSKRTSMIAKPPSLRNISSLQNPSGASKLQRPSLSAGLVRPRTPSPERQPGVGVPKHGPKTAAPRSLKQRPSLNGLLEQPSGPASSLNKKPSTPSLGKKPSTPSLGKKPPTPSLSKKPSAPSLDRSSVPSSLDKKPSVPSLNKNASATTLKKKPSSATVNKKPTTPMLVEPMASSDLPLRTVRKASITSAKSSVTSGEDRNPSSASTVSTALTVDSVEDSPVSTPKKSSSALRDQIAKAKAAKRAISKQVSEDFVPPPERSPVVPTDTTFDFGLHNDPFGQKQFENSNRKVMRFRIKNARMSGRLNIAAMGLKEIPEEVLKMYDLESVDQDNGSWAETVDLTRFLAPDNELETIDDSVFPDTDPSDLADDEDGRGHQFGGLEQMDLHGNLLYALPVGLRRLQMLTTLNLAHNKLANGALEVISQITSLQDLRLGHNLLYGKMDSRFSGLVNLVTLDLSSNDITALPEGLENLSCLRSLNVNENALESLPFKSLSKLPLTELLAHKNKLQGALIGGDADEFPKLQTLDVSVNQLTHILSPSVTKPLSMPALRQLTLSVNRIQSLPDMRCWKGLLTLVADENIMTTFPDGFTSLENLRHVDFTSNGIRVVPPELARMERLALLRIGGNPLKDKRFASLSTEELKEALAQRLLPVSGPADFGNDEFGNGFDPFKLTSRSRNGSGSNLGLGGSQAAATESEDQYDSRSEVDTFATPPTSVPASPAMSRSRSNQIWPVKVGGILDRSNTQSSSLHPVICSKVAANHSIREIRLQHNLLASLPSSLSFFTSTLTSLTITHNQLVGESFLTEELELEALTELNASNNHITSFEPFLRFLHAPNLRKMDVSCNRIVKVPVLRDSFPKLGVLLMSNNHVEELDPSAVSGIKVVDASNNDLAHLNPRLGLLDLEQLCVTGNRFRVPRWNILDRGTEATLRWLRGRVPIAEMAEWRKRTGEVEEDGVYNEYD